MKLDQATLSHLAILDISANENLLNVKHFIAKFILISDACGAWHFLFHEAKTFHEYTYITFFVSTKTMSAACFTIFATKKRHIFKLIDIAEELIEKSG